MRFDFLQWYNWAYCLEDFDSIDEHENHRKIAYSGWLAAMYLYKEEATLD